jgi:hypothetical protein
MHSQSHSTFHCGKPTVNVPTQLQFASSCQAEPAFPNPCRVTTCLESRAGRSVDASANQGLDLWISPGLVQFSSPGAQLLNFCERERLCRHSFTVSQTGCFCGVSFRTYLILHGFRVASQFHSRKTRLSFCRALFVLFEEGGPVYQLDGVPWFIPFKPIARSWHGMICKRGKRCLERGWARFVRSRPSIEKIEGWSTLTSLAGHNGGAPGTRLLWGMGSTFKR